MKKIYLIISLLFFLNGCGLNPSALLGPAFTIGASGNVYKAGLQYSSNKIIQKSTGKTATQHAMAMLKAHEDRKAKSSFKKLVKKHIKTVRKNNFSN
tara:strand:- start:250 stop:540 length:291 start_codon:yes stop_codon:yes gene_type:complete